MQYRSRPTGATHYAYFGNAHFFYIPKFLLNHPAFRQRKIPFYILTLLFSLNEIVLRAFCTTESSEQLALISIIIHILAFFTSVSLLLWMIEIFHFPCRSRFTANPCRVFPLAAPHLMPCVAAPQCRNCSPKPQRFFWSSVCYICWSKIFSNLLQWKEKPCGYPTARQTTGNYKSIERLSSELQVYQTFARLF